MESMKCIVLLLLSLLFVYGASANTCDGKTSGDYCSGSGYITCPSSTVRPCQAGLVCSQFSEGVVYCMRPSEIVRPGTTGLPSASTSGSAGSTTGTPSSEDSDCDSDEEPTSAPTRAPTVAPTRVATVAPVASTPAPSVAPTRAATVAPTVAATVAPTRAATVAPTVAATVAPTRAPTVAPPPTSATTRPVTPTNAPASGARWPYGNPVKAIYIDNFCWAPDFSFNSLVDAGYNLVILAFFVNTVKFDCSIAWGYQSAAQQIATINYAHSKGARIIVSTGGATDSPYNTISGAAYARSAAQWAKDNNLDGIDFDLENFGMGFAFAGMSGDAVLNWVVDATNTARSIMGTDAVITHAPQPPYFGNHGWANGYGKLYERCPHIDFFLVQYYNNGPSNTYETIFINNQNGASVTQIAALGIPMSKIVVGKPVHESDIGDLSQGYNTAAELKAIFARAKAELGWNAGVMGWQWLSPVTEAAWINGIYPK